MMKGRGNYAQKESITLTDIRYEALFITMSYRRAFDSSPKPVEMGKEYEVEISEISKRGDGIARVQGFVIFVGGAKAGQKTKIRITSVGDRFAKAEIV
jgi:predicted RNA-binding protein with TRAM domain